MSSISSVSASISPYQAGTVKSPANIATGANAPIVTDRKNDGDKDDGVTSAAATTPAPTGANPVTSQFSVNALA